MNDTMTAATNLQWTQFPRQFQHPLLNGLDLAPPTEGYSDATVVTTCPSGSYTTNGQLTAKGNVFKPIRRRSRVSKRTPTTLLNANTTNFRALVQKFTGCPVTTMPFSVRKGPITLNFQQGSQQQIIHHNTDTTRTVPLVGTRSYNNQVHQVATPVLWQKQPEQIPMQVQQQLLQEQQSGSYSLEYVMKSSNDFHQTWGSSRPSMEVSDGLLMDNDFSLLELTVNAFSNEIKDHDYFM